MQWIESISPISFPGLGIQFDPTAGIAFGAFEIRFYGLIIAIGLLLSCWYGLRRKKAFGLTEDEILDGALIIIPFAIICARLYYCAFAWNEFKANPISILYIWEGGIAIYGAVIGAAIGIVAYCLIRKLPITTVLDVTAISFLIGQSIGRWGNFFNREAYGAETTNFLRMGLYLTEDRIPTSQIHYFHPTFLYESLWNAAGFALLHFLSKRRKYDGQIALGYAAWYGLGRCFIEGLRTDSLYWGPFRVSQMLAAISCFAAVVMLVIMAFKEHDPANLYVNRVDELKAARALEKAKKEEVEEEEEAWEYEEESEETEEVETEESEKDTVGGGALDAPETEDEIEWVEETEEKETTEE